MSGNQRWRKRKAFYRRPDEQIRTSEYDIVPLPDDRLAKDFIVTHHYSGSYPAARFRFGLFRRTELVGVAVFSHPASDQVLTNVFGGRATDSVELGRLVLLDEVPGNGESFFVGHCLRVIRKLGMRGVLAFSDPVERQTADGLVVKPGHIGTVYQALNAAYLGRGRSRSLRLLPDGTVFSERAISKVRSRERGWEYASSLLVAFGAEALGPKEDARAWLVKWLTRITTPLHHSGNHKYCWSLNGKKIPPTRPYPKKRDNHLPCEER
jgi:hypothetical protein